MAKTLIGNIKGKDGRGISGIEKTATTGVVDTYTITYTDGTISTYEVKNSDEVAIQRQIVPSAAVESSTTASQAYTAGDYVVVGGVLRKVTSSIAIGSTIGDSNSVATTVTGEIDTVRDSISPISGTASLGSGLVSGSCGYFQVGKLVVANIYNAQFKSAVSSGDGHDVVLFTGLPESKNNVSFFAMLVTNSGDGVISTRVIMVGTSITLHYGASTNTGTTYTGVIVYLAK